LFIFFNTMKNFQKGFTLIELMVVISIIAVLSSVVLAGLQTARVKARNSRIVQEVQQLKNQIELTRVGDGYTSLARSGGSGPGNPASVRVARDAAFTSNLTPLVIDILKQNGLTYPGGYGGSSAPYMACTRNYDLISTTNALTIFVNDDFLCTTPPTKYAIYAAMGPIIGSSGYFCVDSNGRSTKTTAGAIPQVPTVAATCQ
jgi:prepilin-type N-terminal cleavage/methylation domain-containing protein